MGMKDSMFRYADGVDKLLMLLGTLGSIGDGLQHPLSMYILSDVINSYGSTSGSLTNDDVDKVITIIYVDVKDNVVLFMIYEIQLKIIKLQNSHGNTMDTQIMIQQHDGTQNMNGKMIIKYMKTS